MGVRPKPPESPSTQLKPRHDGIQVDDVSVSVEDVVPVQVDVAPRRRRHLFDQRQGFRVSARLVLRESTPLIACESFIQAFLSGFERFVCRLARPSNRWLKRPTPCVYARVPLYIKLNPRPLLAFATSASFRGPLCFASLSAKKYGTPYFSARKRPSKYSRSSPKASRSFSVSEKLARYGSSALSSVEHLRLLVGKDSIADALLRHFGSLKALSRASFKELRQFLPKGKAEAVMAALSISNVADAEHALSAPLNSAEAIYRANLDMKGFHQEVGEHFKPGLGRAEAFSME